MRKLRKAPCVPSEERVAAIMELMIANEWGLGSKAALATRWGLSIFALDRDAGEARRSLRRAMSDDDIRADIVARLDDISRDAHADRSFGPAIAALRTQLEARGLLSQKVEVSFQRVQQMSLDEKVTALLADPGLGPLLRRRVLAEGAVETMGELTS